MKLWEWLKSLFTKKTPVVQPLPKVNTPVKPVVDDRLSAKNYFGSPQVKWLFKYWKWSEHDAEQSSILSKIIWKISGLPSYGSIKGSSNAWCEAIQNGADVGAGYKGTGRADAVSGGKWGWKCPPWFGARAPIRHPSGGYHDTRFLFWYDESKKWAACLGGNQSDELNITIYDFSKENLWAGFRWADGQPDGRVVTRAEFEKAFPQYAKYKFSGSTR